MATIGVTVHGDKFSPSSQSGNQNDTVEFTNHRNAQVTVNLNVTPNFYSKASLTLNANGGTGTAKINASSGTGKFKAPMASSGGAKQGDDDIKGEIVISPRI